MRPRPRRNPRLLLETLEFRVLLSSYVVSPTGNDAAAGTAAQPWQTLQRAASVLLPGDLVTVRAGSYQGFQLGWDFPQGGTAAAPIVWNADPGVNIISRNSKTPDGINLEGASYVTIDGFIVTNSGGTGQIDRAGIRSVQNNHAIIKNCTTVNCGTWGIYASHSDDLLIDHNLSAFNNITIPNYWNHHGIYVSDSAARPIVRNNTVYGNQGNGIHFNGDLFQGGAGVITEALVENNIIYDNGAFGGSGINMDGVQNSRVQNNLLFNNHAKGISLYQIDAGGPSSNNVVVNNTVLMPDGAQFALTIKNGSINNKVYNNILLSDSPTQGAINTTIDCLPGLVSNNNAMTNQLSLDDGATTVSLNEWRAETGQDLASFTSTSAALFNNLAAGDYHLAPTSAAIDAGVPTLAPVKDMEGRYRPAGLTYDIGAFEANASFLPVLPKAPSNLIGVPLSSNSVTLMWADKSNNEDYFRLERTVAGGSFQLVALLPVDAVSYVDPSLSANTTYTYRIFAVTSVGSSVASNPASATTASVTAPTNLAASPSSASSIALTWTQPNAGGVARYNIYRGDTQSFVTDSAHRIGTSASTAYSDATVSGADVRYYRVTAVGPGGAESEVSNLASAAVIPTTPVSVSAVTLGPQRIDVSWVEPNSARIDHYNIYRAADDEPMGGVPYRTATGATFSDQIVDAGATYGYAISAVNVVGTESPKSKLVYASITPPAPWGVSAGAASGSGALLGWHSDQPGNVAHYNVYRGSTANFPLDVAHRIAAPALTECADPTATSGQTWYYRVTAVNYLDVESASSQTASIQLGGPGFAQITPFGNLTITGTESPDVLEVRTVGSQILASLNGQTVWLPADQVRSIAVNGLGGSDTLNFAVTGGIPTTFNGGLDADGDTLNVNGGAFSFDQDAQLTTAKLTINVSNGGSVIFHSTQHLEALNLLSDGAAVMIQGGGRYLRTRGLTIDATSILNLNDNDLIWDYDASSPDPYLTALGYTTAGYWEQGDPMPKGGICSGAGMIAGDTVLSIVNNADAHFANWMGETIDATTLIGKYTLFGDVTLDGQVDAADVAVVQRNAGSAASGWWNGDVNLDGKVTDDDFTTIDSNLGRSVDLVGSAF